MKESFRGFCKQVLSCEELVDLWTDIQQYKSLKDNEVEFRVTAANNIWNYYFIAGSIEVPEELHSILVDNLDSGNVSLFDEVQSLIEDDLKEEAYHLFIKDFIKHANSTSNNPLSSLSSNVNDDLSKLNNQISNRGRILQQEQTPTRTTSTTHLTPVITENESPPPPPAQSNPTPPPKKGVRIERLGDKIQVYGRSPTNTIKTEDKASNLEDYKYKGPLIPPNQEIRATVADIDSSFLRSKGEKEQFLQVTCCEVSVNLLYQKIPIITQGSIEGMAEMAKKLYNLKDYLQNDTDSFVMDINSILDRCDRYSAHLQVEDVASINNSRIIQMFKSSEKKPTCCILKAQVIEQENNSFNDYLVVFYDGNESYCLFHTYDKLFPKKGLRACVTYFENLEVMERFFNDFLAPNEHSASKLTGNRKCILKQLITLRKKEPELINKYLNYRVSLHVDDSPLENIEKKLFMMEDTHKKKIEDLLRKLKDIEGKIKSEKELNYSQPLTQETIHEPPSSSKEDVNDIERPLSPRNRQSQDQNNRIQEASPQNAKNDILTEYFINRLSSIESEMNEVKNAYTKKIESVVENFSTPEKQPPVGERNTQQDNADALMIYEMKRDIEMMKIARLKLENKVKNRDYPSLVDNQELSYTSPSESIENTHLQNRSEKNQPLFEDPSTKEENYEKVVRIIADLKKELANLKCEMSELSSKKQYIEDVYASKERSTNETERIKFEQKIGSDAQLDEVVDRVNNIERYAYENMSTIKQALSEERKERFTVFDALHVKLQSVEDHNKETILQTTDLKEEIKDLRSEVDTLRSLNPISQQSTREGSYSDDSKTSSKDNNQILLIQNNLKKEIFQQVNQIHQQINQKETETQIENILQECKKQVDDLEEKIANNFNRFINCVNQEEMEIIEKRVTLLENDVKNQMEKLIDSKVEQIVFVNKNFTDIVNIKVESLDEKVEHLKEFIHMKTRELELSSMNITPSNTETSIDEGPNRQSLAVENEKWVQNFSAQLSNLQHTQSNYDEKLGLISKLYDSSWDKTVELSDSLKDISVLRNNLDTLKQGTENKVGQLSSSVKRIDSQIDYLNRRVLQVDQQKDEQHIEKMTLFINNLSSRVDEEFRKINQYFERKEFELNDKFLELLTRERTLHIREQNLEEREDHFLKHANNHSVNVVKKDNQDENLLLKQVQHHLNVPQGHDYSLDSVLYPLSSVDPELLKKQRIVDPADRIGNEFKDSFLLKSPESLFSFSNFPMPSYSIASSVANTNFVSILNPNEPNAENSLSSSPTSSTSSSRDIYHPTMVASGMQTYDEELKLVTNSSPNTPSTTSDSMKRNRRSSGSQTYKTQFKEYRREDNSIIRSPFRKYAEQKDTHLYSHYF